MVGGLWMPELIELAGGTPLVTRAGEMAPTLTRAELEASTPEVVLVKPCGYDLARTEREVALLRDALPWEPWAEAGTHVYLTDGNACPSTRSGPRSSMESAPVSSPACRGFEERLPSTRRASHAGW